MTFDSENVVNSHRNSAPASGKLLGGLLLALLAVVGCMPASRSVGSSERTEDHRRVERAATEAEISTLQREVLIHAREWLGTPYRYGGSSRSGVDCSGFVRAVFESVAIRLPRTSGAQAESGVPVPVGSVKPGDLLFFNTSGSGVSHVGIALGGSEFIHSSSSRGVIVSSLNEEYYNSRVLSARRVL